MTYETNEKLIYDNTYPVRYRGMARDQYGKLVSDTAVVSEDGIQFFAKLSMLRRPLPVKGR